MGGRGNVFKYDKINYYISKRHPDFPNNPKTVRYIHGPWLSPSAAIYLPMYTNM